MTPIKLATRKSPLALVQATQVKTLLEAASPGITIEIIPIVTSGDKITGSLADIGGKALFTKEIEEALLDNRADIAVHSVKDMETTLPSGLVIGCALKREDARDMLIGEGLEKLADIPQGASFGTSSPRRAAQLLSMRPDVKIVPLRGNVQTRLAKITGGEIRATMLAVAGIKRLELTNVQGAILPIDKILPAVGQGAIAVECREKDDAIYDLLQKLAHEDTENAIACERAFLQALGGSCRTPIAGYAESINDRIDFRGLIASIDGAACHRIGIQGDARDAVALGFEAGKQLLARAK